MESMMTAKEVMSFLRISRPTLWRCIYIKRCLPAFNPPGSSPGKTHKGKRKPNRLLFHRNDVEKLLKQVQAESERAVKRRAQKAA